ncbi:MAG: VVA0879 family protein [Cellulophaga sp.]
MKLTRNDWVKRGEALYGKDIEAWEFNCPTCDNKQSVKSLRQQQEKGIPSKRYGLLKKGTELFIEGDCYSKDCDYSANGLLTTNILVIIDDKKHYNEATKENCGFVLPFSKDKEMLKANGE